MFGNIKNNLSPRTKKIVNTLEKQKKIIMPQDIAFNIFLLEDKMVKNILETFKIDKKSLCEDIQNLSTQKSYANKNSQYDKSTQFLFGVIDKLVSKLSHPFIDVEHIIFAFFKYGGTNSNILLVKAVFKKYGITERIFKNKFIIVAKDIEFDSRFEELEKEFNHKMKEISNENKVDSMNFDYKKIKSKLTEQGYIQSLNDLCRENPEEFIGREKEIERCIQILCRKKKKNALIVGEPGTGKTALIYGVANYILNYKVPEQFNNSEIFSVNVANIVAGCKYRGQFEERMKYINAFFENAHKSGQKAIMFIDEIHSLIGAGSAEGSIDASSVLKPKLSNGSIQCIGTTTLTDYKKNISKDEAFRRRFSNILLEEPASAEVKDILYGVNFEYEKYYKIKISKNCIDSIVELSGRYIKDRFFPDKAFDVLDESCSKTVINNKTELTEETIKNVISLMTGIPIETVTNEEKEMLSTLNNKINTTVIGQESAVSSVSDAIKRSRIGLKDENKPISILMFLGPTGVGKTYLSQTLSEILFGSDKLIRLDMSEFMDKISVNKIVGSPPGYIGYEEGSLFVDEVRKKPYSVILLDEIEKANKEVLNVFLQLFDEGRLTDSLGRLTDFRNTIIIMTSNLDTSEIRKHKNKFGFSTDSEFDRKIDIEKFLINKVEKYFSPEFVNRIDDVVIFNEIDQKSINKIFKIEFDKTKNKIKQIGYNVTLSQPAQDFLCEKSFDKKYGARPIHRTIQHFVEIPFADFLIENDDNTSKKIVYIGKKQNEEKLTFSLK